jgi:peptide/nickel transport system substrate-binding protein
LHTRDPVRKAGLLNASGYSNPQLDQRVATLGPEFDSPKRAEITRAAMALVAKDLPYLPLFAGSVLAASKKNIAFNVRVDEMTLAQEAQPLK